MTHHLKATQRLAKIDFGKKLDPRHRIYTTKHDIRGQRVQAQGNHSKMRHLAKFPINGKATIFLLTYFGKMMFLLGGYI